MTDEGVFWVFMTPLAACAAALLVLLVYLVVYEIRNPCKAGHWECFRTYIVGKTIIANQQYFVCDERGGQSK